MIFRHKDIDSFYEFCLILLGLFKVSLKPTYLFINGEILLILIPLSFLNRPIINLEDQI